MTIVMKRIDGDDTIEFIAFNIDGEGSSLALLEDGSLTLFTKKDTLSIIAGDNSKEPNYQFVKVLRNEE